MKVYTDGACSKNGEIGAPGGWAWVIVNECDTAILQGNGHIDNATNNICELTAMLEACKKSLIIPTSYEIYSDSAYIINCYEQRWYKKWQVNGWINSKKQPVANKELWEQLIPFFENKNYKFIKVKGHAGNQLDPHSYWNNYVDKLAVSAKEAK